ARSEADDEDEVGEDDDTLEARAAADVADASRLLESPEGRARELLATMQDLAARHAGAPDAKLAALLAWMQANQCPALRFGGADRKAPRADRAWSDRRVILFTEYGDTKRVVERLLTTAAEGTDQGDDRLLVFHGGMSDE